MAATEAQIGYGTKFQRGDGATPETFLTIGEITNIAGPAKAVELIDATHMESPGKFREFVYGLKDTPDITVEMQYVPGSAGMAALNADIDGEVTSNYKIILPNPAATTFTFAALVRSITPSIPVEGKMTCTVVLKPTGAITES